MERVCEGYGNIVGRVWGEYEKSKERVWGEYAPLLAMAKTFGETQCKTRKPSACIVLEQLQSDSLRIEQEITVQSTLQLL